MLSARARWDAASSARVNRFVAISGHVAGRIRRYYNRQASVVYPPVDTAFFHPGDRRPEDHFLIVSALVPYKQVELAIAACEHIGAHLRIVGEGPERERLARLAGRTTELLGWLPDEAVRDEYRRAAAVILPGEEDFGIVPLEAQACGRPVVALARGGALETVVPGHTGLLVDEPEAGAFAEAIAHAVDRVFDAAAIRRHAERFGRERFGDEMEAIVAESGRW